MCQDFHSSFESTFSHVSASICKDICVHVGYNSSPSTDGPSLALRCEAWAVAKEARFRDMAAGKLEAMEGLERVLEWIDKKGIKKAAVTNAPRSVLSVPFEELG